MSNWGDPVEDKQKGTFFSIVKGMFTTPSSEGAPGAVKRVVPQDDGSTLDKWEEQFGTLKGIITDATIKEGKFGDQCNVTFNNNGNIGILTFGVKSSHFDDFAKKISNVDLSKPVEFKAWDFMDDETNKRVVILAIEQDGQKLYNYFWDHENKVVKHGFPEADEETRSSGGDLWDIHFTKVRIFLKKHIQSIFEKTKPAPIGHSNPPMDKATYTKLLADIEANKIQEAKNSIGIYPPSDRTEKLLNVIALKEASNAGS